MTLSCWFKIEIQVPERKDAEAPGTFFDVTDLVEDGIVLEETADLLDKLTFTLTSVPGISVMRFIDTLTEGIPVRLWFGYVRDSRRLNQTHEMFVGYIGRMKPRFPEDGDPKLELTVFDPAWLMTQKYHATQQVYPAVGSGAKLTIADVVRKVAERYKGKISVGKIKVPDAYSNVTFTEKVPIVQKEDENDWKFLKRLAHGDDSDKEKEGVFDGCECMVYVELENGEPKLYFVPEAEKINEESKLELVYPMRGTTIPMVNDPTVESGRVLVESVALDDDRETASDAKIAVPPDAFKDVLTEEEFNVINSGGGISLDLETFFQSFDIDYAAIERDEKRGLIRWDIFQFIAGKVGWDDVKQYVKLKIVHQPAGRKALPSDIKISKDDLKDPVKRENYLKEKLGKKKKGRKDAGLTMTVEMQAGNTNIRPRKVYRVLNIGSRYSSSETVKWFADTVTHRIGNRYQQTIKFTQ
jgi:hypothetical protein